MEKQRILIVDDDPVIILSCRRILGMEGFAVSSAEDGESGIKLVSNEAFDMIITDVRLPDVNGMIVLRESRIIQPSAGIMVITGYPTVEDAVEATRLGAFEYIEKPFTPDFMLNAVKQVFDKKGWILRKLFISQFKKYIVPTEEMDDFTVYYKEGIWARPLIKEEVWEIGIDVRHFLVSGQLMHVEIMKNMKALAAGEPFALLSSSDGNISELMSPMTGVVKMFNERANEAIASLAKNYSSEGWQLWLARILNTT